MLERLNLYTHGVVVVPVVLACRRVGLFERLASGELRLDGRDGPAGIHAGHASIALRLLESLGWVERTADGAWVATQQLALQRLVPDSLDELFQRPMSEALTVSPRLELGSHVACIAAGWGGAPQPLRQMLSGSVALPVLVAALNERWIGPGPRWLTVGGELAASLTSLFAVLGWCSPDGETLTDEGEFMLARGMNAGTTLSYRPMLSQLDRLLAGDAAAVFSRSSAGHETHVDRGLNVRGSGFSHEKFFADLDAMIVSIFDSEPIAEQPRYVVDTGSGDGALLERIYRVIREGTRRGRALAEQPVILVAADFNETALAEARRTLAGLPHITVRADIGDPEALMAELRQQGVNNPDDVLHVRTFLDHDRPFVRPSDDAATARRRQGGSRAIAVDRSAGTLIPQGVVVQSLVEHLGRWAAAAVIGRHGLILVEVHSLSPALAGAYLREAESLHFDAYHAFSGQMLVEADVFMAALAEVGLFRRRGYARSYPRMLPYRRITIGWLEKRAYVVRAGYPADLPALVRLEEACWPEALRASEAELLRRTTDRACMAWLLQEGAQVVGVAYAQRIASADVLRDARYPALPSLTDRDGKALQLLGLNVLPERHDGRLSRELLAFVREQALLSGGLECVVGVTRFRDFARHPELSAAEYLAQVEQDGLCRDVIPRFHQSQGARLVCAIEGFRPDDTESRGCGVLIEYALAEEEPGTAPAVSAEAPKRQHRSAAELVELIREIVQKLLPQARRHQFDPAVPLLDAGMDSLDLMELRGMLSKRLGCDVDPTLFFRHATVADLAVALARASEPLAASPSYRLTAASRDEPQNGSSRLLQHEPIAVVGMACRFPGGASDVHRYWQLLLRGVDAIAPPSEARRARQGLAAAPAGYLQDEDVEGFDADFFRIAPREARRVDPQQRLLLAMAWEAFEDAGMVPGEQAGARGGVFVGMFGQDYVTHLNQRGLGAGDVHVATGTLNSVAAGRIAYLFDLRGPALVVDTACSSALAAVHLARSSLLSGEASFALAGAVNLILSPNLTDCYRAGGMLASDGRCKTFAESADGYGRSEGAAMLLLKRLSRARADGDRIWGLIRGSAMSHDGRSNGLTAPNPAAQQAAILDALAAAGVAAGRVGYIEAHGTGTPLGDPIEMRALSSVFGGRSRPLYVGSAKTNIGHAEAAAGLAGLIKTVLAVRAGVIPANLHFSRPNPELESARIPAEVPTTTTPWPADEGPRIAGVSAFGLSGTNVHAVVAEYEEEVEEAVLLVLQAESEPALAERWSALRSIMIDAANARELACVCQALAEQPQAGARRFACVAAAPGQLATLLAGEPWRERAREPGNPRPRLIFACSGEGPGWLAMGHSLFARHRAFRAEVEAWDSLVRRRFGASLVDHLLSTAASTRGHDAELGAALQLALQVALGVLFRSWSIEADASVGYGAGEISAAVLTGALSREDGLTVALERARALREHREGVALLAVTRPKNISLDELAASADGLRIVAFDSPTSLVFCGSPDAVAQAEARWRERGIACGRPRIEHVAPAAQGDSLAERLAHLAPGRAHGRLRSVVSDVWLEGARCGAQHWIQNLRGPLRFMQAVEDLTTPGPTLFIEFAPAPTLAPAIEQTVKARGLQATVLAAPHDGWDRASLLAALGRLFELGFDPCWRAVFADAPRPGVLAPALRASLERLVMGVAAAPMRLPYLISARGEDALRGQAERLRQHLAQQPELEPSDVAWSLATCRTHFERRAVILAADRRELLGALEALALGQPGPGALLGTVSSANQLALLFSDVASESATESAALCEAFPAFRACLEAVLGAIDSAWCRLAAEHPPLAATEAPSREPRSAETRTFALQVALFKLLGSWGLRPDAVLVRSRGGLAAGWVSGVLSLETACELHCWRVASARLREQGAEDQCETSEASASRNALCPPPGFLARLETNAPLLPIGSLETGSYASAQELASPEYWLHAPQPGAAASDQPACGPGRFGCRGVLELGPEVAFRLLPAEVRAGVEAGAVSPPMPASRGGSGADALLLALGGLHAHGYPIDWRLVLAPTGGRRVDLPTYAFQAERCWLEEQEAKPADAAHESAAAAPPATTLPGAPERRSAHPLLHRVAVLPDALAFDSTFSGDEPFLADHVIRGLRILPAAAQLEMARAALERAAEAESQYGAMLALEDVAWARPFVVRALTALQLRLGRVADGRWKFEIFELSGSGVAELCSSGYGRLVLPARTMREAAPPVGEPVEATLDVAMLCERPRRGEAGTRLIAARDYYERLEQLGLAYGPAHRGLMEILVDRNGGASGPQVVARLSLPECVATSADDYGLHPSLIDSAIQACMAGAAEAGAVAGLLLPFALHSIECIGPCTRAMLARIRPTRRSTPASSPVATFDIDICDDQGGVRVKMCGLSLRAPANRLEEPRDLPTPPASPLLGTVVWKQKPCASADEQRHPGPDVNRHVVLCGFSDRMSALVEAIGRGELAAARVVQIGVEEGALEERFIRSSSRLLDLCRVLLRQAGRKRIFVQLLVPTGEAHVGFGALAAMLETARLENPRLSGQVIQCSQAASAEELVRLLHENCTEAGDSRVWYAGHRRLVPVLEELPLEAGPAQVPWKEGGTYLITGGAGRLGMLFAREILARLQRANVVLAGRSASPEGLQRALRDMDRSGVNIEYVSLDVGGSEAVAALVRRTTRQFGGLNGIIHAAGVTRDGFIRDKSLEDFAAVLRPKVAGALQLYAVAREVDLDFLVFFSSIVALGGNIGQVDYCTANAFLDAIASDGATSSSRRGRVLSINWPLWRDGGMGTSADVTRLLLERFGVHPMAAPDGISAFYRALASTACQAVVCGENMDVLRAHLAGVGVARAVAGDAAPSRSAAADTEASSAPTASRCEEAADVCRPAPELRGRVQNYLTRIVGEVLGKAQQRVGVDEAFSSQGMDSILALEATRRLERDLGRLSKTLFFEYECIEQLTEFLLEAYPEQLARCIAANDAAERTKAQPPETSSVPDTSVAPAGPRSEPLATRVGSHVSPSRARQYRVIGKGELQRDERLATCVARIRAAGRQDAALMEVWSSVFIDEEGTAYCHVVQDRDVLFAAQYAGPEERRAELLQSLQEHCAARGHALGYLDLSEGRKTDLEERCDMLCVPVGVVQTISDMAAFSLAGGRMRRLRYLVEKFRKEGSCRTVECTTLEPDLAREIRHVILAWCAEKKVVNNVDVVLNDMHSGNLLARYRVFLTYVGAVLQNVIMILPTPTGYLMDQEYYLPGIPLGCTEYAVTEILNALAPEGCSEFSLGLTWGRYEAGEGYSDVAGAALLENTKSRIAQVFERGVANHQYKAKYGPREYPVYLYRHRSSSPELLLGCLSQFFGRSLTYEDVKLLAERLEGSSRRTAAAVFDALRVDPRAIRVDLVSDSWSHLDYSFIKERVEVLARRAARSEAVDAPVMTLFGLPHWVLTTSGRSAERLLFQALNTKKKLVLQNLLFESTLHNLVKAGFRPVEVPDRAALERGSSERFRGGVDLDELAVRLAAQAGDVGFVMVEVGNNASGGYPISLAQLRRLSELKARYGVPLILDVTRILKNAELIRRHEVGCAQRALWDIVKEIAGHADVIVGSLSKDFGVSAGGVVVARDPGLIGAIQRLARIEGGCLGPAESGLVVEALRDRAYLAAATVAQVDLVRDLHERLVTAGVPLVSPAGGHCILVRVDELTSYAEHPQAREEYLRALFEGYGVRGGIQFVAGQTDTHLNRCVRLAVPLGLHGEHLISALAGALSGQPGQIPDATRLRGSASAQQAEADVDPIAVIGLSGRYPGAQTLDEFWQNLVEKRHSISEIPPQRWDWREHYQADPEAALQSGKTYGKWGAFLDDFEEFDPLFFKISPHEAEFVDPQERLALQECWRALEDAGYPPSLLPLELRQRSGVFGGMTKQGFNLYAAGQRRPYQQTSLASLVSRVCHCLDLKGPALAIDSHCASALVALHEACEYLRTGGGELAVVTAVNLNLHPANYAQMAKMLVLSRDGESAAFGAGGTGYVPGEGVGALILKSLPRAVADGDHIYAVIRGSAINQNGRMARFGMPSQQQQEAVIRAALERARVDPRSISYVEASAYGSEVADVIEASALTNVFAAREGARGDYKIGSVKPNIGHGEAVSGMAQLTKVLLALERRIIPPTLVSRRPSARIDFERLPFALQTAPSPWSELVLDGHPVPRRASVSATGASGVNAHVIVEEYVEPALGNSNGEPEASLHDRRAVFVLSARDGERLRQYASDWVSFLRRNGGGNLLRIARTLQTCREAMTARLAIVAHDLPDLQAKLAGWCAAGGQGDGESSWSSPASSGERVSARELQGALASEDLPRLARYWVQGNDVHWHELPGAARAARLGGLPCYPFARQRFPLASLAAAPTAAAAHVVEQPVESAGAKGGALLAFPGAPGAEALDAPLLAALTRLFSEVFRVPLEALDVREPLESYGIDSYLITAANVRLGAALGAVPKTLLFECQTLEQVASYLLEHHRAACASWIRELENEQRTNGAPHVEPPRRATSEIVKAAAPAESRPAARRSTSNGKARPHAADEPIAVIGISGRYPMARDIYEHWENLWQGRDCIVEIPAERWPLDGFYEPVRERAIAAGKCYSKWGGFIDGFCEFDPLFFNVSPRDAANMDPQERLFLQTCWEVLEDAAYTRELLAARHHGRVGVFAGVTRSEFGLYGPSAWQQGKAPATSFCSLVNRVSYFLDLHGPSIPIDTMCSSSLVAVHEACEQLRRGDCELAIAGGVNLSLHPRMYVSLSAQRMLSSDGRCRSFGKGGDGYVPGEGVAAVLLKPLKHALRDGDRIRALIRASCVNHGGRTNGYTVPNPRAQAEVIRRALDRAGISARAVSYVEAHGTGTQLGDPIEVAGLTSAFRADTNDIGFCALGSVKSNIGHLEAASGIAGLTKVILQMQNETLVPSLFVDELNPNIDFRSSPFVVNKEVRRWERPLVDGKLQPRIAGISSFGAGGSNCHAIVEEYLQQRAAGHSAAQPRSGRPAAIVLSAKKPELLIEYARKLLAQIRAAEAREPGSTNLESLAYTLQVGREAMEERIGIVARSVRELDIKLQQFVDGIPRIENLYVGRAIRTSHDVS